MTKVSRLILGVVATTAFALPVVSLAQPDIMSLTEEVAGKSGYDVKQVTDTTLSETIGRIIRIAMSLIGTIFFILLVYAGFLWLTAQGDEGQVDKAKDIIKTSTMGLVVVMAAYGLSAFLVGVVALTSGAPSSGSVGPGYGTGGFWTSFGKSFKDNWWNYVF